MALRADGFSKIFETVAEAFVVPPFVYSEMLKTFDYEVCSCVMIVAYSYVFSLLKKDEKFIVVFLLKYNKIWGGRFKID